MDAKGETALDDDLEDEVCSDCNGTGEVEVGRDDDITTKKCHCRIEEEDNSQEE